MEPPAEDPNHLAAEALLATVGLHAFLTRDPQADGRVKPIRLTKEVRDQAASLPFRWRTEIRRFLRGQEWDKEPKLEAWDYDEVATLLTTELTPDAIAARVDLAEEPDLAISFLQAATIALNVVKAVLPMRASQHLLGAEPVKPSDIELARLRLVWCTLDYPDMLMRDLNAGMLTRRQADAFRQAFPALSGYLQQLVTTEAVNLKEEKPNAKLARQREAQLTVLLGLPPPNPDLARQLQANFRPGGSNPQGAQGPGGAGPQGAPLTSQPPMEGTSVQATAEK